MVDRAIFIPDERIEIAAGARLQLTLQIAQQSPIDRRTKIDVLDGVQNVHVGRLIELDVDDASKVPQMCERLLANPLIEDYEVIELSTNGSHA